MSFDHVIATVLCAFVLLSARPAHAKEPDSNRWVLSIGVDGTSTSHGSIVLEGGHMLRLGHTLALAAFAHGAYVRAHGIGPDHSGPNLEGLRVAGILEIGTEITRTLHAFLATGAGLDNNFAGTRIFTPYAVRDVNPLSPVFLGRTGLDFRITSSTSLGISAEMSYQIFRADTFNAAGAAIRKNGSTWSVTHVAPGMTISFFF